MKILQITPYGPKKIGGTEVACANLCKELDMLGMSVAWATDQETCEPIGSVRPVGMRRMFPGLPRGEWTQILDCWTPGSMRLLREEITKHDIVHIHDIRHAGALGALRWATAHGILTVVTDHLGEPSAPGWRMPLNFLRHRIRMNSLNKATAAVYVAEHLRLADGKDVPHNSQVIECGVDPEIFHLTESRPAEERAALGWDPQKPTVLYVGRFSDQKRIPVLHRLARLHPEWTWIFVGHGKQNPQKWELPNVKVFSTRDRSMLARYYRAADVVALPTNGEGIPLCVLEGLACGTPAAVSNLIFPSEKLPEGTYVGVDDDMDDQSAAAAWSEALRALLQPDTLRRMRETVRAKPTNMTWRNMAERYARLYESIAREHR